MYERIPPLSLRQARREAGLTQEAVAEELNVSLMTVHRWERGLRKPSFLRRQQLCALLRKSAAELGWAEREEQEEPVPPSCLCDPAIPPERPLSGQQEVFRALQASLLASTPQPVGITGLPGSGKTALACALVQSPGIQRHFDVICWATVGADTLPDPQLARWAHLLGIEALPDEREQAHEWLRGASGNRKVLIVLDDLWRQEDLAAYAFGGAHCTCVLTTRHPSLASAFCRSVYHPAPLTSSQAIHLLGSALPPRTATVYRSALHTIAVAVGNLPAVLETARAYLRQEASSASPRRIENALSRLTHPAYYLQMVGPGKHESFFASLQRSAQRLPPTAHQALSCLATRLSAAPASFSEQQALEILQCHQFREADFDHLLDAGLIEVVGESRYQLHPVIGAYARLASPFLGKLVAPLR